MEILMWCEDILHTRVRTQKNELWLYHV